MKKRLVIFFLAAAMVLGGCENKNSKLYKKGIEALEQKDYVTSIAMLEGAVKAGDRLAESYRSLGIAYLKSQEYDKAKEAFKSSLSSMKHKDAEFSRDVMYYEAETCVQAGDLDGAIEICTNIPEEKADADALFLRGRAYFLQKNYEQAKVDFDAAVETKESYQLCLDIYELYQESSMKADGDRYLEAAVKIEPKTTEDYYNIGCAYYYLEEQDEAVKAFPDEWPLAPAPGGPPPSHRRCWPVPPARRAILLLLRRRFPVRRPESRAPVLLLNQTIQLPPSVIGSGETYFPAAPRCFPGMLPENPPSATSRYQNPPVFHRIQSG